MQRTQEADERHSDTTRPSEPRQDVVSGHSDRAGTSADRDAEINNAQTPPAGDIDPDSTKSSDETGQAGVNDRPGKDQAHPWNG